MPSDPGLRLYDHERDSPVDQRQLDPEKRCYVNVWLSNKNQIYNYNWGRTSLCFQFLLTFHTISAKHPSRTCNHFHRSPFIFFESVSFQFLGPPSLDCDAGAGRGEVTTCNSLSGSVALNLQNATTEISWIYKVYTTRSHRFPSCYHRWVDFLWNW